MKAQEKYLGKHNLSLETLTEEQYQEYLDRDVPLYVSELCEDFDIEQKRDYLRVFFEKEDFKDTIKFHQPFLTYEMVSPKQVKFLNFISRIQCMFGSNKSGKSGGGSKKSAAISLGKCDAFPYKPKPGETIYGWMCSETRALLEDAPLKQIKKWLREDQYEEKRGNGGKIEKIIITADNGGKTEIELKPYEGGVKSFESSNIHFIWCDEPPPQHIFEAMWARLVEFSGWIMITATTVQKDSKYLRQLVVGEGDLGHLRKNIDVDVVELTIWDNKTLTKRKIEEFIAMYPPGSPMYKIRVLGQYAELEGLVFPMFMTHSVDENEQKITWHTYEPSELPDDLPRCAVRTDGLDWGTEVEFAFCNFYFVQNKKDEIIDYTLMMEAEVYQRGLQDRPQADKIKLRWEEYGRPPFWVADRQIGGNPRDGKTTLDIYREEIPDMPLPRLQESDKRNPVKGLTKIGDWLSRINKVTGKPCFRISIRCRNAQEEFMNLLWKPTNEVSNAKTGVTKGKDHIVDLVRYLIMSRLLDNGMLFKKFGRNVKKIEEPGVFY